MRQDSPEQKSKSRRKREATALQALGERLVELRAAQLAQLPLEEPLREAVRAAQRITARGGRRRQLQLIGKLMRRADGPAIARSLEALEAVGRRDTDRLHELENWRSRLLEDGAAVDELVRQYPQVDRVAVGDLLRRAVEDRAASRALFRYLGRVIPPREPSAGEANDAP